MKEKKTFEQRIQMGRESLARQDAWAKKGTDGLLTKPLCVEEHSYGKKAAERMDFIFPTKKTVEKYPIIIYIHGGGWTAGTKEARRQYCSLLAEHGYFVLNMEYTLAPEAEYPEAIGELVQGVDYFLERAGEYPADTNRIAAAGESAGVFYAMYLAAISKNKGITEKLGICRMQHEEFDVKAVFSNCGAVDMENFAHCNFPNAMLDTAAFSGFTEEEIAAGIRDDALRVLNPMNYMDSSFPPTLLMYGFFDELRSNTFILKEHFDRTHVPYVIYCCKGIFYGQHTSNIIFKYKKAHRIFGQVIKFFNQYL